VERFRTTSPFRLASPLEKGDLQDFQVLADHDYLSLPHINCPDLAFPPPRHSQPLFSPDHIPPSKQCDHIQSRYPLISFFSHTKHPRGPGLCPGDTCERYGGVELDGRFEVESQVEPGCWEWGGLFGRGVSRCGQELVT
jgi:hypothetical protein